MKSPATTQLMAELTSRGIMLSVLGETLRYRPRASMTPELLARLGERKSEVMALLRGDDVPTRAAIDMFGGELGNGHDRFPLPRGVGAFGTPPQRACNGCAGRGFHKVEHGPEWMCDTCHPPFPGAKVVGTWTAPTCSVFEAIHERKGRVERTGTRGLGKRVSKLGRSPAPGSDQP